MANQINEVCAEFQKSLAQRIGGEAYEKLTGLKPGDTVNVVNPAIAAAVSNR